MAIYGYGPTWFFFFTILPILLSFQVSIVYKKKNKNKNEECYVLQSWNDENHGFTCLNFVWVSCVIIRGCCCCAICFNMVGHGRLWSGRPIILEASNKSQNKGFFFNINNNFYFYFYFCNILRIILTTQKAYTNA